MSETIRAYGYEWEILDKEYKAKDGKGILCLMKTPLNCMAFSEDDDNDYSNSDIYKRLLGFSRELEEQGAKFRTIELNLMAEDGFQRKKQKEIYDIKEQMKRLQERIMKLESE